MQALAWEMMLCGRGKARAGTSPGREGKACGAPNLHCASLPLNSDRSFTKGGSWCQLGVCVFQNDLTGEHSCIMLKMLTDENEADQGAWLAAFWKGEPERKEDSG